jgi:hypothetical protein
LAAKQAIAKPFSALLASRGEVLQQKFGVDASTADDNLSQIFDEKIDAKLLKDLRALKLVVVAGFLVLPSGAPAKTLGSLRAAICILRMDDDTDCRLWRHDRAHGTISS